MKGIYSIILLCALAQSVVNGRRSDSIDADGATPKGQNITDESSQGEVADQRELLTARKLKLKMPKASLVETRQLDGKFGIKFGGGKFGGGKWGGGKWGGKVGGGKWGGKFGGGKWGGKFGGKWGGGFKHGKHGYKHGKHGHKHGNHGYKHAKHGRNHGTHGLPGFPHSTGYHHQPMMHQPMHGQPIGGLPGYPHSTGHHHQPVVVAQPVAQPVAHSQPTQRGLPVLMASGWTEAAAKKVLQTEGNPQAANAKLEQMYRRELCRQNRHQVKCKFKVNCGADVQNSNAQCVKYLQEQGWTQPAAKSMLAQKHGDAQLAEATLNELYQKELNGQRRKVALCRLKVTPDEVIC